MLRGSQFWSATLGISLLVALTIPAGAEGPADHAAALAAAQTQGQPILLDFFTDW